MTLDGLVGGLLGSILTILATKIFDLIKMRFGHKNTLRKIFFEKKLNAAENAVAKLSSIGSHIHALSELFELAASKKHVDFTESQIFSKTFQNITSQISKLDDTANDMTESIFLYIDLNDESAKKIKEVIDCFAKLESLNNIIQKSRKTYESDYKGTELEAEGRKQLRSYYEEYKSTLNEISQIFYELQDHLNLLVENIRKEYEEYI